MRIFLSASGSYGSVVNMTAYPTENPHPEQGSLWVQYDRCEEGVARHALMWGNTSLTWLTKEDADAMAAQLGQDLPEGFTLGVIAKGAAILALSDDKWDGWEWTEVGVEWTPDRSSLLPGDLVHVRRVAKPAKVRVKVGDAYGRTIDGKRIVDCGVNRFYPNGHYTLNGNVLARNGDADGMVEVDPLDGDR